ncbi:hypothetical protein GGF37_000669 [Kickxella alabastrina]|nr:hypothetical protein GGF37_000669 [Kickxella alabastrina]
MFGFTEWFRDFFHSSSTTGNSNDSANLDTNSATNVITIMHYTAANNVDMTISSPKQIVIDIHAIGLYAAYSGAAYSLDSDKWACGIQCSRPDTEGTVIKHRWKTPQITSGGFIAVNPNKKAIVVSFRGTAEFQDWIDDIIINSAEWPLTIAGSQVGAGFLNGYEIVSPLIIQKIHELAATHPEYSIVATGHSLGGARAAIFAADISANHPHYLPRLQLYTYGQPRCGNSAFVKFMDSLNITKIRVVNKSDLIPHLPAKEAGYHHFGTEFWVAAENQFVVCQDGDYSMCSESVPFYKFSIPDHTSYSWI